MDISQALQAMLDRDGIRDCLARLARGEDRRDADALSACFWPDSTFDYAMYKGTFPEYLAWVVPGADAILDTTHVLGQSVIELDGNGLNERAKAETHVISYHRVDMGAEVGERDTCIGGRYLDTMEKRGGAWRIAQRTMLYDWYQDWGQSADWSQGIMGYPFHGPHYTGSAKGDWSETFLGKRKGMMMANLAGKVAVVTGASRGIGKGTACILAEQGATVYLTARTIKAGGHALPGSIEETVAEIGHRAAKSGGKAIGVALDLHDDEAIAALFGRVRREQGRLDILVNNAMAIPQSMTEQKGFWQKPLADELDILDTGVRAAFIAAHHAANIMAPQGSGLIVGMSGYVGRTYTYDVMFGTAKTATDRMARDMGVELKPYGVASVSLWQGFTHTERATENLKAVAGMASQLNAAVGSSPEFVGRVIAALSRDPDLLAKSGGSWIVAELAAEYGVTDIDGRMIPSLRAERGAPIFGPV